MLSIAHCTAHTAYMCSKEWPPLTGGMLQPIDSRMSVAWPNKHTIPVHWKSLHAWLCMCNLAPCQMLMTRPFTICHKTGTSVLNAGARTVGVCLFVCACIILCVCMHVYVYNACVCMYICVLAWVCGCIWGLSADQYTHLRNQHCIKHHFRDYSVLCCAIVVNMILY